MAPAGPALSPGPVGSNPASIIINEIRHCPCRAVISDKSPIKTLRRLAGTASTLFFQDFRKLRAPSQDFPMVNSEYFIVAHCFKFVEGCKSTLHVNKHHRNLRIGTHWNQNNYLVCATPCSIMFESDCTHLVSVKHLATTVCTAKR
jgi:hypothetical protein